MEETLKLILEKISSMDNKMNEMQQDMSNMKQDMSNMKQDMSNMKQDMSSMNNKLTSLEQNMVRLENKVDEKLSALFDGYSQNTEAINLLNEKVDKLVASQERQDVEIKVIHTKVN